VRAADLAVSVRVCMCVCACVLVSARTKDDDSVSTDRRQVQDRTRILAFASTSTPEDSLAAPHTSYVHARCARKQTHFPPPTCAHNAQTDTTDTFGFEV
jgi:hypothetical protein